jgi:hypothetical protein
MSIADPDVLSDNISRDTTQVEKSGSMTPQHASEGDDQLNGFDIDTFTRDYRVASKSRKKEHIFGRAEFSRGDWDLSEDGDAHDPHDRFNRGPAVQRYTTHPYE